MVPDFARPDVDAPAQWSAAPEAATAPVPVTADWWRNFGSAELDRLMSEALGANQDLAAALARIDQARAGARIAGAPLLPFVEATGSSSRTRTRSSTSGMTMTSTSTNHQGQLTASYELDLWGKNRAALKSAKATVDATSFDKDALALILQADVAATYFQALASKQRLAIARDNLDAARQVLQLVEAKMSQGAATALEVAQQRAAVATFEAQVPVLWQLLEAAQTAIAILLGRPPGGFAVQAATLKDLALPAIAAGQPSALLERRPDIRRNEAQLLAANADIGAARAAFYPSVTLSAAGTIESVASGGTTTIASLAAGLVAPIFTGGQLEGELDRTKGRKQELVANYRQAVLTAFKEVEDSLSSVQTSSDRSASLARAVEQSREAFRLAQLSYGAGASDFLTVLDAQRTLLDSEDGLVQAELDRYTTAATLFKALGGGWAPTA